LARAGDGLDGVFRFVHRFRTVVAVRFQHGIRAR
jgi:hypothetical protein